MRYLLLIILGACSYGVLSTFVKLAYDEGFGVNGVTGSQMMLGVLMMFVLYFVMRRKDKRVRLKTVSGKKWLTLLLVGAPIGLTGMLYYGSLQYIPASIAIVLLFQFTWIGVLIEAFLDRRMPGKEKLFALIPLVVGTVMAGGLFDGDSGSLTLHFGGIVLGLLSAVSYAAFIIFSGRAASDVAPISRSLIMLIGGLALVWIVYPPTFLLDGSLWNGLLLWGLLLALFGAVIPTICFTFGVPHVGGGLASILSAAELPTAVLMSSLVLREHVSLWQWLGVVLILAGIALPELIGLRKRAVQKV